MNRTHPGSIALLAGLIVLVFTREAYGYIDPGTGSFILQVALGSLFAAAVAVKMFWRQIMAFLGRLFARRQQKDSDES